MQMCRNGVDSEGGFCALVVGVSAKVITRNGKRDYSVSVRPGQGFTAEFRGGVKRFVRDLHEIRRRHPHA